MPINIDPFSKCGFLQLQASTLAYFVICIIMHNGLYLNSLAKFSLNIMEYKQKMIDPHT